MRVFWSRPHGAAAVEFALVLPLLLTVVFGTIEWGYYFFTREIVINSAREGARAGTLQYTPPISSSDVAVDTAKSYLTGSGLTVANATVSTVNPAGTCPADSSCIRVQYTLPTLTGFLDLILGKTRTIDAYAEMRK